MDSPIQRKARTIAQETTAPYWDEMPSFSMADATPARTLNVHFLTHTDYYEFCRRAGIKIVPHQKFVWFPEQTWERGAYVWDGPKVDTKYPVCIPSKGRWKYQTTARQLDALGVSYRFFVEETEYDSYAEALGTDKVVSMPFHDLGSGSIPARNFIWKWALEREHKRHWVLDDNLLNFERAQNNRRIKCVSGALFQVMEDFVDRYENIALAGPHDKKFINTTEKVTKPVHWNSRVYSCILVDTALPFRWRGKYNEDTDLSLRVLKAGYCTALFRALLIRKADTACSKQGARATRGGNTDTIYATGDKRRAFAESLQKQHPDVVTVVWKYNRWHHQVDYSPFKDNKPVLREGVLLSPTRNEYGMQLVKVK